MTALPVMSATEMILWSAATGAMAMLVLTTLVDAVLCRTKAAWQLLLYMFGCALLVTLLGGLPEALLVPLWPKSRDWLLGAQVLLGPLCGALGCYGVSKWLYASRRDRIIRVTLDIVTKASLAGGPLCLVLPPDLRLPASAALSVTAMAVALWLTVRAARGGDSLAWGLATGCVLALPAQIGLYQIALASVRPSLGIQAGVAFASIVSTGLTGLMIWRRNRQIRHLYESRVPDRDPVSGLLNGLTILQKIIASQLNRRRNGGDGALMAVMLFDPELLLPQIGHTGLNELYTELALRTRRHTGIINPAGRYYDRCFLVLFETMHSPQWLARLSLKTAASLRVPIELTSLSGERILVRADVGVGIIHVAEGARNVDELVHEAQAVATVARGLSSRAALLNPRTGRPVAAETAELGSRWASTRSGGSKSQSFKKSRADFSRPA